MANRVSGLLLVLFSITLFVIYLVGLVIAPDTVIAGARLGDVLVRFTILVIIAIISVIIGYIGYQIFTAPQPKPIEEVVKEFKEQTR